KRTSGEVGPSSFSKEKIYDKENRRLQKNSRLTSDTLYGQESGQFHYAAGSRRSGRTHQRYSKQKGESNMTSRNLKHFAAFGATAALVLAGMLSLEPVKDRKSTRLNSSH